MTTTPRDLLIVTMDMPAGRPVERGDLSLALAGAELIDLLRAGVVTIRRDRIVAGERPDMAEPSSAEPVAGEPSSDEPASDTPVSSEPASGETAEDARPEAVPAASGGALDDTLLAEAAASVSSIGPDEPVGEWLWQHGRGLAATYLAAFEAEGQLVREGHRRWGLFRSSQMVLVDSPARRRAANRWAADEPVLAALATAIGVRDKRTHDSPEVNDPAAGAVLAAVTDALAELADERQRRARKLDDAAVTNYRRGY